MEELQQRRVEICRLEPQFALVELDDAIAFVHDRGLVTLTPCCSLPSLFAACHEEPHSPGKPGYGRYPKTRWWWGGALAEAEHVTATKLHGGKTLYLAPRLVDVVAPLCLESLADAKTGRFGEDAARIVGVLEAAGPSTTDDFKEELGLDARRYQRARTALEKHGAVLSRHVTVDADTGGHRHLSELRLWEHVPPRASATIDDRLIELLVAAVSAAVVLPKADARRAFTWTVPQPVVERAVGEGRVMRPTPDTLAVSSLTTPEAVVP